MLRFVKNRQMSLKSLLFWSIILLRGGEESPTVSASDLPRDYQKFTDTLSKLRDDHRRLASLTVNKSQELDYRLEKLETDVSKLKTLFADKKSLSRLPSDCLEVKTRGYDYTGTFFVQPTFALRPFSVVCEMAKRGGGWTLILKRSNYTTSFNVDWKNYKYGFGHLGGDFWLGLENIHQLSSYEVNELLVELVDSGNRRIYAYYKYFSIGGEDEGYLLRVLGGYSGDAGDSLAYHAGSKFSTIDKDQDNHASNCAALYTGGWWYNACHFSHLTGKYSGTSNKHESIGWGEKYFLKEARMYLRPHSERILFP